jgi:hypothetical protein
MGEGREIGEHGCKLVEPPADTVRYLDNFDMLSEKQITGMLAELP